MLTIIILTRDEEQNLVHALRSLRGLDADVWVVDSGSTDRTVEIALGHGCHVLHREWTTYAGQFNWALGQIEARTPWCMRLDADERLTPALVEELRSRLPEIGPDVTGLQVRRRVHFWGRWIRHGGFYPTWLLRIWRTGTARCEGRWMDEHMIVDRGRILSLEGDIIDENHKGLGFWTIKHEGYASREVRDLLRVEQGGPGDGPAAQAGRRRWAKEHVYVRSPRLWRAGAYWFMRYILQRGFLDGREGLVFHFLQAFWYRFLVDAKLIEEERRSSSQDAAEVGPGPVNRPG
ncbi:MAG: glycosyltransferase family 2 protein [Geminicoccaceae bacterium]|nr:glycosyltransferase family 2 protein [Geminicoccaceae bacterium]MCB9945303.1 glycosyltransferase family 2 protein [Geminicoccaceae bacterium]